MGLPGTPARCAAVWQKTSILCPHFGFNKVARQPLTCESQRQGEALHVQLAMSHLCFGWVVGARYTLLRDYGLWQCSSSATSARYRDRHRLRKPTPEGRNPLGTTLCSACGLCCAAGGSSSSFYRGLRSLQYCGTGCDQSLGCGLHPLSALATRRGPHEHRRAL